ncbi:MAG: hypothetical protein R2850_06020 [Bacteroidia bacterium]
MKMSNQFSDDFEKIILNKSFGELSADELKALEAEGISESEFEAVRNMLKAMAEIEEEQILPAPELKNKLLSAFNEPVKNKGRIIPIQTWIITGLSAAALIALAFFIFKPGLDPAALKPELSQNIVQDSGSENNHNVELTEPVENTDQTEIINKSSDISLPEVVQEPSADLVKDESEIVESVNSAEEPSLTKSEIDNLPEKKRLEEKAAIAESVEPTKMIQAENLSTTSVTTNFYSTPAATLSSGAIVTGKATTVAVEIKKSSDSMKDHKDMFATLVTIY